MLCYVFCWWLIISPCGWALQIWKRVREKFCHIKFGHEWSQTWRWWDSFIFYPREGFCLFLEEFVQNNKIDNSYSNIFVGLEVRLCSRKVQRDAHGLFLYSVLHYTCSTCFGCSLHPSSGAQIAEYSCRYARLLWCVGSWIVFWVISVYFNLRNFLPKSGTFHIPHPPPPGQPVYRKLGN
jgi:hypothetical protein